MLAGNLTARQLVAACLISLAFTAVQAAAATPASTQPDVVAQVSSASAVCKCMFSVARPGTLTVTQPTVFPHVRRH
jgi:hypothetical protein